MPFFQSKILSLSGNRETFLESPWALAALLLLTCLVFAEGVTHSFSSDDFVHLLHNIYFRDLSEALQVFTQTYGREYRPMVRFSLWLNSLMGSSALPYKLTNLALHLICCWLLHYLLRCLGTQRLPALIATAIFALHPIHVTSVHFILGRTDLVAAVFYLATLALVVNWPAQPSIKHHLLTMLPFAMALVSKELSVSLPISMGLILIAREGCVTKELVWRLFRQLWIYAAWVLIFVLIRVYLWGKIPGAIAVYTQYSVSHILNNYAQWLFALLYSGDLYQAQDLLQRNLQFFAALVIAAITAFALLLVYLLWPNRKLLIKSPLVWLAILWLPLTLLPMIGGNPHRWYLYLPSACLSFALSGIWPLIESNRRNLLGVLLALILVQYSWETLRESHDWKRQSELSQNLLSQMHALKLKSNSKVYLLNLPFGYKGTFLFSFSSLAEAMTLTYGQTLQVVPLSYMNLAPENKMDIKINPQSLEFNLIPSAYRYFMLSASERQFSKVGLFEREGFKLEIERLAKSGKIMRYKVTKEAAGEASVYFFDGEKIQPW